MTRFRELRKKANLTQEELIAQFNARYEKKYTAAAISQFEHDKRMPATESLKDFADFFGVTVDYLLGRPSTPAKPSPVPLDLTDAERAHLERYRQLTEENRKTVDTVTRNALASQPRAKEKATSSSSTTTGEAAEQPA